MNHLMSLIFVLGLFGCAAEPVRTPASETEEGTFLKKVEKKNAVYDKQN